jgi:hypothetical protein
MFIYRRNAQRPFPFHVLFGACIADFDIGAGLRLFFEFWPTVAILGREEAQQGGHDGGAQENASKSLGHMFGLSCDTREQGATDTARLCNFIMSSPHDQMQYVIVRRPMV